MTRINSAIRPECLTDEHLLAEHREIKRMPSVYMKRKSSKLGFLDLPTKFTLGKGHVLYFVDKAAFTVGRYELLHEECTKRGFNVEHYIDNWKVYMCDTDDFIMNDHFPTKDEYEALVERISMRLMESSKPYWHYYGTSISKDTAVNLLKTPFGQKINLKQ